MGARIALAVAVGVAMILAQACGGGSADVDATPTAKLLPTSTPGSETPISSLPIGPGPGGGGDFPAITPGAGMPGPGPFMGGASEEFAAFLGISLEQLQSELEAEGATPASVAEAHGRTRDELKSFFIEQTEAQINEAVAAGTMSQEDADNMLENLESRIDDMIDGTMMPPGEGGPGPGPVER